MPALENRDALTRPSPMPDLSYIALSTESFALRAQPQSMAIHLCYTHVVSDVRQLRVDDHLDTLRPFSSALSMGTLSKTFDHSCKLNGRLAHLQSQSSTIAKSTAIKVLNSTYCTSVAMEALLVRRTLREEQTDYSCKMHGWIAQLRTRRSRYLLSKPGNPGIGMPWPHSSAPSADRLLVCKPPSMPLMT